MILVIGGAYQGKLSYALERYGAGAEDVHECPAGDLTVYSGKRIVYKLERLILALVRSGADPVGRIRELSAGWKDTIIICDDISGGIVPMEAEQRAWREAVGRCVTYLAGEADEVVRLFCGIGTRLK